MKKITALVLAILMTAAFTGCAPKEKPAAIEEPQATPEPEPQEVESTIEQNPVSAFYTGYRSATVAMEALFRSRLEDDKSAEAADTLLYLADHDMRVSEGNATFGWLLSTGEEDQFASSVTGAAEGKGSIAPHGVVIDDSEEESEEAEAAKNDDGVNTETMPIITENLPLAIPNGDGEEADAAGDEQKSGYDLKFEYADGTVLSGSLNDSVLSFHVEGQDKHSVTIEFQDNVWVSTVTRDDGTITTLRCDVDGFHF
ncbi:MAG: hypothetical protein SPE45_06245, partial [Eubacteriales bacterium]|nr:hypothetical protein [Eubacteriales bacterium]